MIDRVFCVSDTLEYLATLVREWRQDAEHLIAERQPDRTIVVRFVAKLENGVIAESEDPRDQTELN